MTTDVRVHSDLAIPPGEYLEEVIESLGMPKSELAKRMDRPPAKLSAIFKGEKAITSETALQLETAVGVPAHIWTALETEYRLALAREKKQKFEANLEEQAELVPHFCYKDLAKIGAVEKHPRQVEKVRALQSFFGVASLTSILELRRYRAAFRCGKSNKAKRSPEAVAAWLRLGERRAQAMDCAPFRKERLEASLPNLRKMTLESPDRFMDSLKATLANCGVALVICPHFPKTQAHGATFWLGKEKAVLMLSLRGKWADIFWFSLFHEIGHILMHNRDEVFLEDGAVGTTEKEADQFAADTLIHPNVWKNFITEGTFSERAIRKFANDIGISPGIVVGRLHHEKLLPHNRGNRLRQRYEWVKSK